jgi:hypothetical protein
MRGGYGVVLGFVALAAAVCVGYWFGRQGSASAAEAAVSQAAAPKSSLPERAPRNWNPAPPTSDRAAPPIVADSAAPAPAEAPSEAQEDSEPKLSAEQERERQRERLRKSGPDTRNFLGIVRSTFRDWEGTDIKLGPWYCYKAGCYVDAVHGSMSEVPTATHRLSATDSFNRWNSGKMRTGEVMRPDGSVEVTWVLFAPADDAPVLQEPPSAR